MNAQGIPPTEVYAGTASVRATRDPASDGIRIAFSGAFALAELGPIIAWAANPESVGDVRAERSDR